MQLRSTALNSHHAMMGLYSLCLMLVARLVAFLTLICIGLVHCHDDQHSIIVKEDCRLTFLLIIKSNESGLQLDEYLFPEDLGGISQWPGLELEHQYQMHFIPSLMLSSACGDQYFRCQHLLVETLSPQNHTGGEITTIVFVPLETGLLLLSYRSTTSNQSTFLVNSSDCSPTVVYRISSNFYMVCVSSHQYVAVYELEVLVNLNSSMIEGAVLFGPLINVNISYSPSSSHLSNFIIVGHQIYFAIGNTIIVMDILDTKQTQLAYPKLPQCSQIHKLVHVPTVAAGLSQPNIMLVAYCSDRYIYFDPVHGELTGVYLFSSNGMPYLCPNNSLGATLYMNGTLQLYMSSQDSLAKTINNVSISSGICFEFQNRTYFAYSDQQSNNIFAYDFTSQNHHIVSSYNCSRLNCPQLLLLENQYLVVRDDRHDIFLDVTKNFSLLINTSSDVADILAILHLHITPGPSPCTQNSTIITTATPGIHRNPQLLVGITLTVVGLFIILSMAVAGFLIRYLIRRKRHYSMYRTPRVRYVTNQSPSIPLIADDSGSAQDDEQEEEEEESCEMKSMASHSRESRFGMEWRWTTTL